MGVGLVAVLPPTGKPHKVPDPNSNMFFFLLWGANPALPEIEALAAGEPLRLSKMKVLLGGGENFYRDHGERHGANYVFNDFNFSLNAAVRHLAAQRLRNARQIGRASC